MNKGNKLSGFILAGGKSSRMGFDKGLLMVKKKRMIEMVADTLSSVTGRMTILSNNDSYDFLGLPVQKDIYSGYGPLGGIYTALSISPHKINLIVSCDMPYINKKLLEHMLANADENEIVVPSSGKIINPLCGVYKKNITENIYNLMINKVLKMQEVIRFFNCYVLPVGKELDFYTPTLLKNINSKKDLTEQYSKDIYAL